MTKPEHQADKAKDIKEGMASEVKLVSRQEFEKSQPRQEQRQ